MSRLVLTRRVGEAVVLVGLDVRITVVAASCRRREARVQIAIEAPLAVQVSRAELLLEDGI